MSESIRGIELKHCQAVGVTSRQDGSVRIAFVTPELRPSEGGTLLQLHGKNVCVSIVPEDVDRALLEIVKVDTEREVKTPSQRLRAVLYVFFKQEKISGDFESYYANHIDACVQAVKDKLNP